MRNPFEVYTSLNGKQGRRSLDWEESALDSQKKVEEGLFDPQRRAPNLRWLGALLAVSFLVLGFRLFRLQIVEGSSYRTLSQNNRIRSQVVLAPRGIIEDRSGQILTQNTAGFNLVAVPFDLPKQGLPGEISELAATFNLSAADIQNKIGSVDPQSINPVVISQGLSQDQNILFQTKATDFYGFQVQQIPIRQYLNPQIFSNVMGYTGLVSPGDLDNLDKASYAANDFIGKTGVEQQYEQYLHGTNGENLVEVDATGKVLDVLGESDPTPGNTLVLNIDAGLQQRLYNDLISGNPNRKAAAVAIDPRNGQVLALVSVPGYDNNQFAQGISQADYQALLNNPNLPLFNRPIAGTYPPGSTVKPMSATAALETGVITLKTIVVDNGVLRVPNQYNPAQEYLFHGWNPAGLGPLNVEQAIALSSDIFFYEVAGGYPGSQIPNGLGAQALADWFRKFNLGKKTGIDLPGEATGLVPDPAWKAQYYKDDPILSKWYLGDTYHMGIGQGDLLVTPLQMAEWISIIANNGTSYVPQVVNRAVDANGNVVMQNKPQVLVSNIASQQTLKIVQQGMRDTVLSGTAQPLKKLPITSAGKTGTSQFDGSDPNKTHAWFVAYAPFEDPQIVIDVLVEAGGEGNAVSEPIVQDALQWWATNRYNKDSTK